MEQLLIIDGNSIINRSFYALPLLTNSKGEFSNAVYGFANTLTKAILDLKPKYIAVAFDFGKKTFRNEIYSDYKATRKGMPSELACQMPILKNLLSSMGISYFEMQNIEADDIIGTIAKTPGVKKVLLSGDRDLFQLLDDSTIMWFPKKGVSEIDIITSKNLEEKFGCKPEEVVEFKSIRGDASDNIPGVVGIGEKGAFDLIKKYGTLEKVYENLNDFSPKMREKLEKSKDLAFISKKLATINRNVPLDFKLENLTYTFPYSKETYNFFEDYEFKSLLKRKDIFSNEFELPKSHEKTFEIVKVESEQTLDKLISYIKEEGRIAFDFQGEPKISCSPNVLYSFSQEISMFSSSISLETALEKLKPIFENKNIEKICYDFKKHLHILSAYNISPCGDVFDLSIAKYLTSNKAKIETDPPFYFFLKKELKEELENLSLMDLYFKIELPLTTVLFSMEKDGLKVDENELLLLKTSLESELEKITEKVVELAGESFNINSPKQLGNILFNKLGLLARNNKKNSTNVEILQEISLQHPIVPEILKYRKIQKLLSTYVEAFYEISKREGGYIRTIFNQTLTATGRLSSSEPNLQNLPIRDEEGKKLRKVFVSRFEGGEVVSADYNQIELRLMAHYSQDKTMIASYKRNEDIHARTASEIFEIPLSAVSANQRRLAKSVNFGIIYGISEYGLSQNLGISVKKAAEYMKKYFERFPRVKEYMNESIELAKSQGYAKTLFGRIRPIPELSADNSAVRKFGERVAINMPLQGTASDIIKLAMIHVSSRIKKENLQSKLVLQIHDELIVDSPSEEVKTVKQILKEEMESVASLSIPLPVEVSSGKNLYECK